MLKYIRQWYFSVCRSCLLKSFRQFRIPSESSTALSPTPHSDQNPGHLTSNESEIPVTSLTERSEQVGEVVNSSSQVGGSLAPSASGQAQTNTASSSESIAAQNHLPIKSEPSDSSVTPNQAPSNSDVSTSPLLPNPDVNTNQSASTSTSPQRNSPLPSVETLTCPVCRVSLHPTRPFSQLHQDRDLQKIIYLLRPGLAESMHLFQFIRLFIWYNYT